MIQREGSKHTPWIWPNISAHFIIYTDNQSCYNKTVFTASVDDQVSGFSVYPGDDGGSFTMMGETYDQGIVSSGESNRFYVSYNLQSSYDTITLELGHVDSPSRGSAEVSFVMDSQVVEAMELTPDMIVQPVTLDAAGVTQFQIVQTLSDSYNQYGYANIAGYAAEPEESETSAPGSTAEDANETEAAPSAEIEPLIVNASSTLQDYLDDGWQIDYDWLEDNYQSMLDYAWTGERYMKASAKVNLRESPGTEFPVLCTVDKDEYVQFHDETINGWSSVSWYDTSNGNVTEGFIRSEYLTELEEYEVISNTAEGIYGGNGVPVPLFRAEQHFRISLTNPLESGTILPFEDCEMYGIYLEAMDLENIPLLLPDGYLIESPDAFSGLDTVVSYASERGYFDYSFQYDDGDYRIDVILPDAADPDTFWNMNVYLREDESLSDILLDKLTAEQVDTYIESNYS